MTEITVATGKVVSVTDGQGSLRRYEGGENVFVPSFFAAQLIADGIATAAE